MRKIRVSPFDNGQPIWRINLDGQLTGEKFHAPESMIPKSGAPVFGKDHAPTISWSGMTIRRKVIPL
jgi:hypothetical protein